MTWAWALVWLLLAGTWVGIWLVSRAQRQLMANQANLWWALKALRPNEGCDGGDGGDGGAPGAGFTP